MARPPSPSALRAVILVLAVGASLGACGRRGRLEPPPTPESIAAAEKAKDSKSGLHKRAPNPPIRPPQQSFVLDPIL
ncbi:hypothetical protein D3273_05935 [Lichenibacterium minor]|uniref:Lipoprotein n=1 Tax=Lichenibacterium minor TaxID=2316528 RepID=A0A4Q2UCL2_9HYPH|nr:lipoprotein [Lichenibacterium minor]RYC32991.1 hypothetical protein D3273_05935 [Lichenibacterium minor]